MTVRRAPENIMATTYLQEAPVPGKWYVSERIRARSTSWHIIDRAESLPKLSTSEMIVAGPFDSRTLATAWNIETGTAGYIWEKT